LTITQAENGCEECVGDLEGEGDDARLVVVLDAHRHHVQEDENEDGDLESGTNVMVLLTFADNAGS
jgi:hypothetical protein